MTDQEHSDIVNKLTNFIMQNGKHQYDDPIPNCWEAGMIKAILLINEYVQGENSNDNR